MQSKKKIFSFIFLIITLLYGGVYYIMKQKEPIFPNQNSDQKSEVDSKSPSAIIFTFPTEASILPVGKKYPVTWSGQNHSDQTPVTLYATNPSCANVGLVPEGERGCSAEKLGTVTLGSGAYQLTLDSISTLVPLNIDHRAPMILFFDTPQGRVTSKTFTIVGSDFSVSARIEKTLYTPGETIRFSVGGTADTGELLSTESGFTASSWLEFDTKNNLDSKGEAKRVEGVFDPAAKQWNFVTTAPLVRKNEYDYRIFVYLKCQDQGVCKQKYSWPLEKDVVLKFNVNQK